MIAAALGLVADAAGVTAALLVLPAFTVAAAALAVSLPREGATRVEDPCRPTPLEPAAPAG
jgi:hypothetical protein